MAIRMDGAGGQGMSLESWKALAARGEAPTGQLLRKQYLPDEIKEVEGRDRTIRFVISTGSVDRDRDTIAAAGWKLDNYRKNPVVLWAHDYRGLPLAKAVSVDVEGERLVAMAEFDTHPMAETVLRMLKGGFLRATSVGFDPLKHVFNDQRGGVDFTEQELLEFSIVPVPANPEALMEAAAKGIDVEPLRDWAHMVLEKAGEIPSSRFLQQECANGDVLVPTVTWARIPKGDHGPEDCPMGEECPMRAKGQKPEVIPPEDGKCPAGWEMGEDGMCHEKAAGGPSKAAEADVKVLLLEEGPGIERFLVEAETVREAMVEYAGQCVRSAIGALKGRVD